MSLAERKKGINDKVNKLDETQLIIVEKFLETISSQPSEWDLKTYVNEILKERQEVLQKLAQ